MKTPLTKARWKHHLAYNGWKYILALILSIVGWNLIYTMTAYRPPEDKKVDVYLSLASADQTAFDGYLEKVWKEELPDMEEVQSVVLTAGASSDYYGAVQLSTYIMAGEGDVYLLSKDDFINYARDGGMLELESYVESGALDTKGIDVTKGWRTYTETGERHLYGIPADSFGGMEEFGIYSLKDYYWCVLAANGNDDNAVKLLNILVRDFGEKAEGAVSTATDLADATVGTATDLAATEQP